MAGILEEEEVDLSLVCIRAHTALVLGGSVEGCSAPGAVLASSATGRIIGVLTLMQLLQIM